MKLKRIRMLIALALMIVFRPGVVAMPKFSDWAAPTNLGCQINSPFGEQGPAISKDGLNRQNTQFARDYYYLRQ